MCKYDEVVVVEDGCYAEVEGDEVEGHLRPCYTGCIEPVGDEDEEL